MSEGLFLKILQNAAVLFALVLMYKVLYHKIGRRLLLNNVALGFCIGLLGVISIEASQAVGSEALVDSRSILISVAGIFFGLIPTLIGGLMMIIFRLIIGGQDVAANLIMIFISASLGICWNHFRLNKIIESKSRFMIEFYFFGLLLSGSMLLLITIFIKNQTFELLFNMALPILVSYPAATYLLCLVMVEQAIKSRLISELSNSEAKYRELTENMSDVLWTVDLDLKHTYVSPSIKNLLGYSDTEFIKLSVVDYIPQEELFKIRERVRRHVEEDSNPHRDKTRTFKIETHFIRSDGSLIWVALHVSFIRDKEGIIVGLNGVSRDISDRRLAENMLQIEHQRLQNIIKATNVGTWEWNVQTGEQTINERWAEMLGYRLEEVDTGNIETWKSLCHPEDLKKNNQALEQVFAKRMEYYDWESRMKHKDGHWVWICSKGKVNSWTADGKPLMISGTHTDISDQREKNEAILYLSYHDQLTGLYNRRFYEEELDRIDKKRNLPISIIMGDVDGLKLINDTFGHAKVMSFSKRRPML